MSQILSNVGGVFAVCTVLIIPLLLAGRLYVYAACSILAFFLLSQYSINSLFEYPDGEDDMQPPELIPLVTPQDSLVDIIAVQGLGSHYPETWQGKRYHGRSVDKIMWLSHKDLLPKDLPKARILAFKYNSKWLSGANFVRLEEIGYGLQDCILEDRRRNDVPDDRPIIFIGHSYGGLVIKQALRHSLDSDAKLVARASRGIVFLGTPHKGSPYAHYALALCRLYRPYGGTHMAVLETLCDDDKLYELDDGLWRRLSKCGIDLYDHIICVFETVGFRGFSSMGPTVTRSSACLDGIKIQPIGMACIHEDLNKFSQRDGRYESFVKPLKEIYCCVSSEFPCDISGCMRRQNTSKPDTGVCSPHSATPFFTGRENDLDQLVACFSHEAASVKTRRRRIAVLWGRGGQGKTQLALRFIEANPTLFSRIYFINASSAETIITDLTKIGRERGLSEFAPEDVLGVFEAVREEWLMVFDNADDPHLNLGHFFPKCSHGNIIITTRNKECIIHAPESTLHLQGMVPPDAEALLLSHLGGVATRDSAVIQKIVEELGWIPLAVSRAAAYISKTGQLHQFLDLLSEERTALLNEPGRQSYDDYTLSLYASWNLSLQVLTPVARRLLSMCAFLDQFNIAGRIFRPTTWRSKVHLLTSSAEEFIERLGGKRWSEFKFQNTIAELTSLDFLESTGNDRYEMHSLVQEWIRYLDQDDAAEIQNHLCEYLCRTLPDEDNAEAFWVTKDLLPHLVAASANVKVPDDVFDMLDKAYVICQVWEVRETMLKSWLDDMARRKEGEDKVLGVKSRISSTYRSMGKYYDAEQLFLEVVEGRKRVFGDDHAETLTAILNLASTYRSRGKYDEAERLEREVVEGRRQVFGDDHAETLTAISNLAYTYHSRGKYDEAEQLFLEVVEGRKRVFGDGHAETLTAISNLAITYRSRGKYDEAEQRQLEVVEGRKRVFGDDHTETLTVISNLASTYWSRRKYDEAEQRELEVVEGRKRMFGDAHAETLTAILNLASTYRSRGKYDEAERLEREVVEGRRQVFGNDHAETLAAISNLAYTYQSRRKYEQAEQMILEVVEGSKRVFGDGHAETLTAISNLAYTYRSRGKYEEAEQLELEVVKGRRRVFGDGHPETLSAISDLAYTYRSRGKYEEAEQLELEVVEGRRRVFGDDHAETLKAISNLAYTYQSSGKYEQAEQMILEVVEGRRRVFGDGHAETLAAISNLAYTYQSRGKYEQAEQMILEVVEGLKRVFGDGHAETLTAISNLAYTYRSRGKYEEAEQLELEVVEGRRRVFGNDHAETLEAISNLAITYRSRGKFDEAERLELEVLEGRK